VTTIAVPTAYDPVTLVHWLWWKLRCHEGSAEDFQKLFENVVKRAQPEFMQIRPYGNIGDRKCDGLRIPGECCHPFRSNAATRSGPMLPPIPA